MSGPWLTEKRPVSIARLTVLAGSEKDTVDAFDPHVTFLRRRLSLDVDCHLAVRQLRGTLAVTGRVLSRQADE